MNVAARNLKVDEQTTLVWAKLFSEKTHVPVWLQAMVTAWFFVTYIDIPGGTAIRYLLVMGFVAFVGLKSSLVLPTLVRTWPLFALPVFGLLSFTWSSAPSDALRQGIYFILTPLIIVVIVSLMDSRRAMRCLMFAGWITALMVLPYYGSLHIGGPYPSKNYVALQMNFMMLLSLTAALNRHELRWVRLAAIPFTLMGILFVIDADSATQLVLAFLGILGLFAFRFMWVDIGRLRNVRGLVLASGLIIVFGALTVALNMPQEDFFSDFLKIMGKDSTLSGRKLIWDAGRVVQDQYPVFGTGLGGFWQRNNGAAQSINFYDFKPYGTSLTFHNAYMEVRVHLGLIGWAMYIATWAWQGQRVIRNWLTGHSLEASALMVLAILVFISTFAESTAWSTFTTPANMVILASVAGFGSARKRFEGYVPVKVTSTET